MDNTTGKIVRNLRNEKRITQTELANVLGLTRRMICAIELGESQPTKAQLKLLSDFFNVTVDYLLTGNGKLPITTTEQEILSMIRNDSDLFNKLLAILHAKKNLNNATA